MTSIIPTWDRYFVDLAQLAASRSKVKTTTMGAIIVGPDRDVRSTGYNDLPRGIDDAEIYAEIEGDLEARKRWEEHAERNAVYRAARYGRSLWGSTAYLECEPCADCCRALIQSGIIKVVLPVINPYHEHPGWIERWKESCEFSNRMLNEAGVEIVKVDV